MDVIEFRQISFHIDGETITKDVNFCLSGMCRVENEGIENPLNPFNILFDIGYKKEEGFQIDGDILVNGRRIQTEYFYLLFTKHILFDGNETIREVLTVIDSARAEKVLDDFQVNFADKRMNCLTIEEARIFEVLASVTEMPPLIYIRNLEIHNIMKRRCIRLLQKYTKQSGSICLVQTNHNRGFKNILVNREDRVFLLSRREYAEYSLRRLYERTRMYAGSKGEADEAADPITLSIPFNGIPFNKAQMEDSAGQEQEAMKEFNFGAILSKYKCENLVVCRGKSLPLMKRFLLFDIFRINFHQAIRFSIRKYTLMLKRYNGTINIYRNIAPFLISILGLRIYNTMDHRSLLAILPYLLGTAIMYYFQFRRFRFAPFVLLSINYVFRGMSAGRMSSFLLDIFRTTHSSYEARLTRSMIYLAVIYSNATIFVEDRPFISYYLNKLATPGTYLFSVLLFFMFTHFPVFTIIGLIFNIKSICCTTLNAFVFTMALACATTKRMREVSLGLFISLSVFPYHLLCETRRFTIQRILTYAFAPDYLVESYTESQDLVSLLEGLSAYYLIVYLFCCYRVSLLSG